MKLCRAIYIHALAAVLSPGLREAAAAPQTPSLLRNGEEKAGATGGSGGPPVERSLGPKQKGEIEAPVSEDGDDTAKDVYLFDQKVDYSEKIYDKEGVKMLCPKLLSCRKGLLAVMIDGTCTCLKPCSKVCRNFSIKCDGNFGAGSHWEDYENLRCYQWERAQAKPLAPGTLPVSKRFLRTTCKCPRRDYSVSNACQPWTQANLSNCIRGEIATDGTYEINFGDLTNVQLGRVRAHGTAHDIDFQGDVTGSHFCELVSVEGDVEFGGEACPINFQGNSVMSTTVGKDFKFEEGAWVSGNFFGTVSAADDWQFNGSTQAIRDTVIYQNTFVTTAVDDKCNYNNHNVADADIDDNACDSFTVADDTDCGDVYDGFSCVP